MTAYDFVLEKYGEQYQEEIFIFNCMDHNDFMEYLTNRYNTQFYEKMTYEVF